jgi:tetratricopeptide (TPR) repeat protein
LPLFGGPGYEAALAAGIVLPSSAAIATALLVAKIRPEPFDAFGRGVAIGVSFGLIALGLSVLHGLRAGFCDLGEGVIWFALAPGPGSVMGGAWGAVAGLIAERVSRPRRRVLAAIALALSGPLFTVLVSLWRFVSSPMVFGFDAFFGLFSGPLYDTVIDATDRLISYRVGSSLTLLAGAVFFWHLSRTATGVMLVSRGRKGVALLGVAAALGSVCFGVFGHELGHWSSTETIARVLERNVSGKRCDVLYSPNVLEREARLTLRDCDAHVEELESWFETKGPDRITVFLFESDQQKGQLMGATGTLIAKPWRREIYIQHARYPHPVLRHELAHVIAGSFGAGPFRVAGPLGGWLPDPGRIEGVAEAAAPDESGLTDQEWARAMLELGILPPLQNIFRLSFLGENSSKAYTVAGAFIAWLHQTHGAKVVRGWYGGADLRALTGKDLPALERDWLAALRALDFPKAALETARARFDRPAIFGRKCPRIVDRYVSEANGQLGRGDVLGARRSFEKVLALDDRHVGARLGLGSCAMRAGDDAEARRRWAEIASDERLHKMLRMLAVEQTADLDLASGDVASATRQYREVARATFDEDQLRTLDVKSQPRSDMERKAIVSLLVGDPRNGRDFAEAAAAIGNWGGTSLDDGLPPYLVGRNLYNNGRYEEARVWLDRALDRRITLERVRAETVRVRLILACILEEPAKVDELAYTYSQMKSIPQGKREAAERLARRCVSR